MKGICCTNTTEFAERYLPIVISHPLILFISFSFLGHRGAGAYLHHLLCERQGEPWSGCKSGPHTNKTNNYSFTNLQLFSLSCMLLVCKRNTRVLWKNPHMHSENMQTPHRKVPTRRESCNLIAVRQHIWPLSQRVNLILILKYFFNFVFNTCIWSTSIMLSAKKNIFIFMVNSGLCH